MSSHSDGSVKANNHCVALRGHALRESDCSARLGLHGEGPKLGSHLQHIAGGGAAVRKAVTRVDSQRVKYSLQLPQLHVRWPQLVISSIILPDLRRGDTASVVL